MAEAPIVFRMRPIGVVRSDYRDTAEVPKGCGAKHEAEGILEIDPELAAGLQDIEGFSHLFVDRPHGVFATRSPYRPNPIGLTVVRLLSRDGNRLHVHGLDMLDGTPILDIKPYLSSVPAEQLKRGWLAEAEAKAKKP